MREIITNNPAETQAFAESLAKELRKGDVIAYRGGMGVGKTTFTAGLAKGLGLGDVVSSPTFALVNEYQGKELTLFHFDLFRITDLDGLYSIGYFDYLDRDGILVLEWSENIDAVLEENTIYITFEILGEATRKITVEGRRSVLKILAADSSATAASVAICEEDKILSQFSLNTKLTHSQTLVPMIDAAVQCAALSLADIDRFAVAAGPGSFTGLRIGISVIKGMADALGKPCVGISTLDGLAQNLAGFAGILCPVMDARCNQFYNALYESDGQTMTKLTEDRAIFGDDLIAELKKYKKKIF